MKRLSMTVLCGMAVAVGVSAQDMRPVIRFQAPVAQFKSRVDLVHLDVSVLDRNRRPVRNLTASDFTVLEDGRPQQVSVFTALLYPDAPPPPAAWMRDVAPDVHDNTTIEQGRLFLLALDDAAFAGDLGALGRMKDIARSVVDHLGPTDLAAVVYSQSNQHSQDFTRDRSRLLAAIDAFPVDPGIPQSLAMLYSVGLLQRATDFLADEPERRKAIFYVGTGVPFSVASAATPVKATLLTTPTANMLHRDLQVRIQDLFDNARIANVNVYTIDACGLRAENSHGCAGVMDIQDYFVNVAAQTGGRPIVNTNDFESELTDVFRENSSYYLLGYQPTNAAQDGRFRRLTVRVNRPGVTVRTRSGYYAPRENDRRAAALRGSPVEAAVAGVLPETDLPLRATAAAFGRPGRRDAMVSIALGIQQPTRAAAGRTAEKVHVTVGAYNTDGRAFGTREVDADVVLRPGPAREAEYEVLTSLDLKPGRYQLRLGAGIDSLSITGGLYYDIDVPDFSRAPVSLSGLVLSATPALPIGTGGEVPAGIPVPPTTRRQFGPADQVVAFGRVYQDSRVSPGGVAVRWEIRNVTGAIVFSRLAELDAAGFTSDRSADLRLEVPLMQLPAGPYVLTVEAIGGETRVRRDSRFEIVR